ncbi:MAG: hypothetical protein ACTSYS_06200 [Promethearchaeota archaeon]
MPIVICPSCGGQFQHRGSGQGKIKCPICGYMIPQISGVNNETVQDNPLTSALGQRARDTRPTPIPFSSISQPASTHAQSPLNQGSRNSKPESTSASQKPRPVLIPIPSSKPKENHRQSIRAGETNQDVSAPRHDALIKISDSAPDDSKRLLSLSDLVKSKNDGNEVTYTKRPGNPPLKIEVPKMNAIPGIKLISNNSFGGSMVSLGAQNNNDVHIKSREKDDGRKNQGIGNVAGRQAANRSGSKPLMQDISSGMLNEKRGSSVSQSERLEDLIKSEMKFFKQKIGDSLSTKKRVKKSSNIGSKVENNHDTLSPPENLNDILKSLLKIDPFIKASALVKRDGTILASTISTQISDSLIGVIGTTVTNIAKDVIFATDSGELKHVTFTGTSGLVHIVPVVNELFLIVLTGTKSKKGIIEVVSRQAQKLTRQYLNI